MRRIIDSIRALDDRYHLLAGLSHVPVAFSGGKDSLVLSLALRELGYTPILLAVDMGYNPLWPQRLSAIAAQHELSLQSVSVRDNAVQAIMEREQQTQLQLNLETLSVLETSPPSPLTPCTYCYNSKIFGLRVLLDQIGINTIAFGHHGTDAVASLLKAVFMYLDRWRDQHDQFDRTNFERITDAFLREFSRAQPPCWRISEYRDAITQLLASGKASPDEPPLQRLTQYGLQMTVVRPMFYVLEAEIMEVQNLMLLHSEGSGCGHSATFARQTPREIVHFRALRLLENTSHGRDVIRMLLQLIQRIFDDRGALATSSRANRRGILGESYKPTVAGVDKVR